MTDSYDLFKTAFNISDEDLIRFGLEESRYIALDTAAAEWEQLKQDISRGINKVRGCGRHPASQQIVNACYHHLFGDGCQILVDPTNNRYPSDKRKLWVQQYGKINNFQMSHVWVRTKNPYAFMGFWNIVAVPKVIDPFTGHESHGPIGKAFATRFRAKVRETYADLITDFEIITAQLSSKVEGWLTATDEFDKALASGCKPAHMARLRQEIATNFAPLD